MFYVVISGTYLSLFVPCAICEITQVYLYLSTRKQKMNPLWTQTVSNEQTMPYKKGRNNTRDNKVKKVIFDWLEAIAWRLHECNQGGNCEQLNLYEKYKNGVSSFLHNMEQYHEIRFFHWGTFKCISIIKYYTHLSE